jgi:putative PIN family toxin of toxin-antitoxin system
MIPLRLVIDTNIVISAALKPDALQRTVLLLAITKPAILYVSPAILAEYSEVLSRPNLKIRKGVRQQFLQLIKNRSHPHHSNAASKGDKGPG